MTVRADETCPNFRTQCKEALTAADSYIKDQEKVIDLYSQEIVVLKNNLTRSMKWGEEEHEKATAWYRQPEFVIPMSLFAGFILAQELKR